MSSKPTRHVPVMVREVLQQLDLAENLTIVDGTVGGGGHSSEILKQMPTGCRLIGLDRDPAMLARAAQQVSGEAAELHQASYAELDRVLDQLEIQQIDRVLLDLGLSSDQLADADRGFGFETAGRLDMRFDPTTGTAAADLLAEADQDAIAKVFADYGEEPRAADLARAIVHRRQSGHPVQTADELKALIEQIIPTRKGKSHPATRLFQALRIAVNRELEQLETFLDDVLPRRMAAGGRALIITFHSLEDRLVKEAFRKVDTWDTLTRKPITATPSEVRWNPRSRSAKLRVARRREENE